MQEEPLLASSAAAWLWDVLLVVVLLGLVRFVVLAVRGKVTWRANTPVMDSHPRLFFAAVVLVIGGALIWLAIQAVG